MIAPELYGLLCVSLYALGNAWSLQGPSAESMLSPTDVSSGSKSNDSGAVSFCSFCFLCFFCFLELEA